MCSKGKPEVSASREGGVWAKVGGRGGGRSGHEDNCKY